MDDAVARISAQWRAQWPDLDMSPIDVIGRVRRLAALINQLDAAAFAETGLSRMEFEVLSALRRADGGLRPSQLTRETLSSGAATTKRLARLEAEGLINRTASRRDRREVDVHLTERGRELIDRLFPDHLDRERQLLEPLEAGEREQLGALLAKLLGSLDGVAR
ncbi:DNA-binding transcriptional regulator, MarR family [Saccharopolyspora kobensis]|uniref:DNA-binding transcriptional regulator, MarR family n=1 Tax=Saccharopolyspora kobensis TaxID=146035 RepID=A0A1H5U9E3_9PSEU|nr:MarR family transcriptional regulator [Saccharopolyspora kobensis]SEF71589.1 DNA-binding transcriptional regulator, MarR family [Saccharopolyspora kobensis]SFC75888.1 DNA-binding transcriptional regulator, MarR family [Saccharopolyspora kobensis]